MSENTQESISVKQTPKGGLALTDKIALDPTQTDSILQNMQRFIDERQGPMNQLMRGLKGAYAVTGGPTAVSAYDREKALEDKDVMDYRQQMGALRAAQAQSAGDAARLAQFEGGTGVGAGGAGAPGTSADPLSQLSPEARQRYNLARSPSEKLAIVNEDLKTRSTERAKKQFDPGSLELKDVMVYNPNTQREELQKVNSFQYQQLLEAGLIRNPTEWYKAPAKAPAAAPAASDDVLPKLQQAVFGTESSSGKADTTKPGVQGAVGPMQVTQDTWNTFTSRGIIPKEFDINNAEQNKTAGNKILEYYYKQYNGDIDKTLAAYHGGEGAINKDGSINLDRKDALGTTIGDYIAKNKKAIGLTTAPANVVPTTAARQGAPDVAGMQRERVNVETEEKAAAEARGKSGEAQRAAFEIDIEPNTVADMDAMSKRMQKIVKENPEIAGVINKNDYTSAVAGVVQKGIGNFGVADLENAIFKTLPETTQKSIGRRSELITYLARVELQAAKIIKGQGQITEGEREILQRASSSISDPAELIYKKARILERANQKNEELAKIYGSGEKFTNFRKFAQDPQFQEIMKKYRQDLNGIMDEEVSFNKPKVGAKPGKVDHPEDILEIIKRNKAKKAE
jgi:soluble lytic murein transglycosylase-like protein